MQIHPNDPVHVNLTKREHCAIELMKAFLSNVVYATTPVERLAQAAIINTDALFAELNKEVKSDGDEALQA